LPLAKLSQQAFLKVAPSLIPNGQENRSLTPALMGQASVRRETSAVVKKFIVAVFVTNEDMSRSHRLFGFRN
jgi:hypothetical protein